MALGSAESTNCSLTSSARGSSEAGRNVFLELIGSKDATDTSCASGNRLMASTSSSATVANDAEFVDDVDRVECERCTGVLNGEMRDRRGRCRNDASRGSSSTEDADEAFESVRVMDVLRATEDSMLGVREIPAGAGYWVSVLRRADRGEGWVYTREVSAMMVTMTAQQTMTMEALRLASVSDDIQSFLASADGLMSTQYLVEPPVLRCRDTRPCHDDEM